MELKSISREQFEKAWKNSLGKRLKTNENNEETPLKLEGRVDSITTRGDEVECIGLNCHKDYYVINFIKAGFTIPRIGCNCGDRIQLIVKKPNDVGRYIIGFNYFWNETRLQGKAAQS